MQFAYLSTVLMRHKFKSVLLFKSRGVARVSPEDYPEVIKHSWALACGKYAIASFDSGRRRVYLHRFILGVTDPKIQVDHRDGDTLNCCRYNLRKVSQSQNSCNQRKRQKTSSRYKGVRYFQRNKTNPWMASIKVNYRSIHLGYFPTEELAAKAYNAASKKYHGKFGHLNQV